VTVSGPGAQPRRVVAIHQPNFFPWLGYFDKIVRADVFVVLDHVQFPKSRPGSWLNRVQLSVGGRPAWVTMPVVRTYHGLRRIDEMSIDNTSAWRRKLLQLLRSSYGRAAAFAEVFPAVSPLVENGTDSFVDYNLSAITTLCERLGIGTGHLVRSSTLAVEGQATDLLVGLVRHVGGTVYLAGGGAGGYQDDTLFHGAGLDVEYQRFQHPVYPQRGAVDFVPGLSILDALFNCGFANTSALLTRRPAGNGAPA
jgi:hypothetical protein